MCFGQSLNASDGQHIKLILDMMVRTCRLEKASQSVTVRVISHKDLTQSILGCSGSLYIFNISSSRCGAKLEIHVPLDY